MWLEKQIDSGDDRRSRTLRPGPFHRERLSGAIPVTRGNGCEMLAQRQAQLQQRQATVCRRFREHAMESFRISMHDDQQWTTNARPGESRQ